MSTQKNKRLIGIVLDFNADTALRTTSISMTELRNLDDQENKSSLCFDNCSETSDMSVDSRKIKPSVSSVSLLQSEELDKAEQDEKKAQKKKLKKQRQKEKKKIENSQQKNATEAVQASKSMQATQTVQETKDSKHTAVAKKSVPDDTHGDANEKDNNLSQHQESEDSDNISDNELDFTNNIPVFLRPAMQKTNKLKNTKTCNKAATENKNSVLHNKMDIINKNREHEFNDIDDFKFVKGKRQKLCSVSTSELYGKDGVQFILENRLKEALEVLSMAIETDTTSDLRHYINRGFCYLRLKQFSLAISDAHYVMKNTDDISLIAKAKYQASVAARELQNFEAAERYLQDCINLMPQMSAQIELLRLRFTQLRNLGFPEDVSLNVLKKCSTTAEAITLLTEHENTSNTSVAQQNAVNTNFDKSETYHSDADDTSVPWLLLNIARSQYNKQYGPELQTTFTPSNASNNGTVKKVLPTPKQVKDIKKENKIVNERAVWVGNVTSKMTHKLLQDHFSRFGEVVSVRITQKELLHYAFVNYKSSKAVVRALAAKTLDVDGTKLLINKAELRVPAAD